MQKSQLDPGVVKLPSVGLEKHPFGAGSLHKSIKKHFYSGCSVFVGLATMGSITLSIPYVGTEIWMTA